MESAVGPLVLALRSLRSQILFSSKRADPLLVNPRHFGRSCAVYWYVEILQRGFEGVFVAFRLATLRALSLL